MRSLRRKVLLVSGALVGLVVVVLSAALLYLNLADLGVYRDQGRYGEAEPLYDRAMAIHQQTSDAAPQKLTELKADYAELLRRMGRVDEAAGLRD